jgi:hypothetical protein
VKSACQRRFEFRSCCHRCATILQHLALVKI